MWKTARRALYGYDKDLNKYDEIIFAGAISFDRAHKLFKNFDKIVKSKKARIILTDNFYRKRYAELNKLYKSFGLIVYAFPGFMKYCKELNPLPYYQPFDLGDYPIKKNDEITVCHTPYHESKLDFKGSKYISEIVRRFNVRYEFVMGKSWQETLSIRSRSHITIDAITEFTNSFINNIGKSGLEGCWLKSAVISTSDVIDTDYFPSPPIVTTTVKQFPDQLSELIFDNDYRERVVSRQRAWAEKYTSYEFVAKHLSR